MRCLTFTGAILACAVLLEAASPDIPVVSPKEGWDNLPPATVKATDWPWWRGPDLNNHAPPGQKPPLQWSESEKVLWRITLPGQGHATPCISGNRIFLPAGDRKQETIWMLCLDRSTGKVLWQTSVYKGPFPKIHNDNSPASATPACDGERVLFPYQTDKTVNLAALDFQGNVLWNNSVAPYQSVQGYSASPAIYRSVVIIPTDGSLGNGLTAIHRKTGEIVWQVPIKKVIESYASPLVARVGGRYQAFLIGGVATRSYDPANGKLLWECAGPAEFCAATVAFNKDTVFATGGYPEKALLAIRTDGAGDVTSSHILWKSDAKAGYVPSPMIVRELIYTVSDIGLARCYDATNGSVVWERNLKSPFYSSPVLVGDQIYLFDRKGKGYVIKAGRQFEQLATNDLPDGAFATPVFLDNRIFLRTLGDFYCLGEAVSRD